MPKVGEPMATYCKWLKKKFEHSLIYQVFCYFFLLPKSYMWPSQCKSIRTPDKLDENAHIWNSADGNSKKKCFSNALRHTLVVLGMH